MQSDQFNENFSQYLKDKDIRDNEEHQTSGKISPSKLTKPTSEAVLSLLGVPTDPPSMQGLRYFIRGNTLEKVAIDGITHGWSTDKVQTQVEAEYKNAIGYIDLWYGMPHEIKSTGAVWTNINGKGTDWQVSYWV